MRAEDGQISFRFQHQQFQEFFAAGGLRARLVDLVHAKDPKEDQKFLASYVNEPRWGESLRMLAEDIGASCGKRRWSRLARNWCAWHSKSIRSLQQSSPAGVGRASGTKFGRRWACYSGRGMTCPMPTTNSARLAAMLATGSDDFKDIVVPLLTDPNNQVRLAVYHSGAEFLPSSLGPHWVEIVQSWPEDARLDLILQLAHDPWLADTVEQLALADPSPKIKWNAARQLSWYGFTEKVEKLLGPLDDGRFPNGFALARSDEIPPSLWPRAIEVYERCTRKPAMRSSVCKSCDSSELRSEPDRRKDEG